MFVTNALGEPCLEDESTQSLWDIAIIDKGATE
jgi:hypothetical protein